MWKKFNSRILKKKAEKNQKKPVENLTPINTSSLTSFLY